MDGKPFSIYACLHHRLDFSVALSEQVAKFSTIQFAHLETWICTCFMVLIPLKNMHIIANFAVFSRNIRFHYIISQYPKICEKCGFGKIPWY